MKKVMGLAVLSTVLSSAVAQEAARRPAPEARPTAAEIARHVRGASSDKLRVVRDGAVRTFEVADAAPIAAELLVLRPAAERTVNADGRKFQTLPFKLDIVDSRTLATRSFWPVIHAARERLEFDAVARAYCCQVLIGVVDENGSVTTTPLPEELTLQLVTSYGQVLPGSVAIRHAGPPFSSVALQVTDEVPDVRLTILWGAQPDDAVKRTFAVHRPKVDVTVNPARIAGFGLAVADIVINAPNAGARGVKSALVSHDRGRLEGSQEVILNDAGVGIAHLRSGGVGTAKVSVSVRTFESSEREVGFHWPIAFLVSAVLGGLVGGFVRYVSGRRKRVLLAMVRSTLIGLVAAVGSAIGVNLLGVELPTGIGEAIVFFAAALGAMWGVQRPGATPAPKPA